MKNTAKSKKANLWRLPARFTVEASLLMLIIIPFLIALIIGGFYIHDRTYMQGVSCELTAMGSNLRLYDNRSSLLNKRAKGRLSHTLMWSRTASADVSADGSGVSSSCKGSFPVPGLTARMLSADNISIQTSASRNLLDPAALIWKVRSARYLIDQALEGG